MKPRIQVRFHCLGHWSGWAEADADTRRTLQPGEWEELRRGDTVVQQGGLYEIRMLAATESHHQPPPPARGDERERIDHLPASATANA